MHRVRLPDHVVLGAQPSSCSSAGRQMPLPETMGPLKGSDVSGAKEMRPPGTDTSSSSGWPPTCRSSAARRRPCCGLTQMLPPTELVPLRSSDLPPQPALAHVTCREKALLPPAADAAGVTAADKQGSYTPREEVLQLPAADAADTDNAGAPEKQ